MEIFSRQDMTYNAYFPFTPIKQLYCCILVPIDLESLCNINTTDKITIIDHTTNKQYTQSVIFDRKYITINNQNHLAFFIAPGISIDNFINSNLSLLYNNNTYELNYGLTKKNICKLIIGLFILSDNYLYKFNTNDTIQLYRDNTFISGKVYSVKNKFNYYSGNKITTILDVLNTDNMNLISFLHQDLFTKTYVRSLSTLKYDQLGSIVIKSNANQKYNVTCLNYSNNDITNFELLNRLEIDDLPAGNYNIKIQDEYQHIVHDQDVIVYPFDENINTQSSLLLFNKNNQQQLINPL